MRAPRIHVARNEHRVQEGHQAQHLLALQRLPAALLTSLVDWY